MSPAVLHATSPPAVCVCFMLGDALPEELKGLLTPSRVPSACAACFSTKCTRLVNCLIGGPSTCTRMLTYHVVGMSHDSLARDVADHACTKRFEHVDHMLRGEVHFATGSLEVMSGASLQLRDRTTCGDLCQHTCTCRTTTSCKSPSTPCSVLLCSCTSVSRAA